MNDYDIVALGELLIDFTGNGISERGNGLFEANPGGAPCNVLAMAAKFGRKCAFIGKVGQDSFGDLLQKTIEDVGIDKRYLVRDSEIPTTLAFVHKLPDGDRSFSFYRKPGADMMLRQSDIDEEVFGHTKIFHFGTLSMTSPEVRQTTLWAVAKAKEAGCIISLDPNLREPLWDDLDEARKQMLTAISLCDILKISDNELTFVTGLSDYDAGVKMLEDKYHIPIICLTMGKEGSRVYYKGSTKVEAAGFVQEKVVDTTGAGDTFFGCVLSFLAEHGLDDLSEDDLRRMLTISNAAASIITTRPGAIRSMPEVSEVMELVNS